MYGLRRNLRPGLRLAVGIESDLAQMIGFDKINCASAQIAVR